MCDQAISYVNQRQTRPAQTGQNKKITARRLQAIQDKNYKVEAIQISKGAEQLIKDIGLEPKNLSDWNDANPILNEVHVEVIDLINRAAQEQTLYINNKECVDIIHSAVRLAHLSMRHAQNGNIATSFSGIDFATKRRKILLVLAENFKDGLCAAVHGAANATSKVIQSVMHPIKTLQNVATQVMKMLDTFDYNPAVSEETRLKRIKELGDLSHQIKYPFDPMAVEEKRIKRTGELLNHTKQIICSLEEVKTEIEKITPIKAVEKGAEFLTECILLDGILSAAHAVGAATLNQTAAILERITAKGTQAAEVSELSTALSKSLEGLSTAIDVQGTKIAEIARQSMQANTVQEANNLIEHLARARGPESVWSKMQATQECYPKSAIPRSFVINVEGEKLWASPNATKHIHEYFIKYLNKNVPELHKCSFTPHARLMIYSHEMHIQCLYETLGKMIKDGIPFKKRLLIDGWQLEIRPAKIDEGFPALVHARHID